MRKDFVQGLCLPKVRMVVSHTSTNPCNTSWGQRPEQGLRQLVGTCPWTLPLGGQCPGQNCQTMPLDNASGNTLDSTLENALHNALDGAFDSPTDNAGGKALHKVLDKVLDK